MLLATLKKNEGRKVELKLRVPALMVRHLAAHSQLGRREDSLTEMPLVKEASPFSESAWKYWQCLHMDQCERFVMLTFRCDGTNIFLLLVDSSKFKREIF